MSELLSDLQKRMRVRQIPGVSIRVARNGTQLFGCELGVSDLSSKEKLEPRHLFRVGCLTKPIVAHGVLHLAEQGRLGPGSSICCFVPELEVQPAFGSITLSHLLSHTSGLVRGDYHSQACSDEDNLLRISRSQLVFRPGEEYKYSNWGYYLLGKAIERISGFAAETFISRTVFSPLAMNSSRFFRNGEEFGCDLATGYWKGWRFGSPDLTELSTPCPYIPLPNCAAGIISNADDYLRWLIALTGGGEGVSSIADGVVEQMLLIRREKSRYKLSSFGFIVELIDDLPFYYFPGSGSGFSGFIFLIPDLGLTGVALSNHGTCNNELREMLYQVCRAVVDSYLPNFGRRDEIFDLTAENSKGKTLHLKGGNGKDPELVENNCRIKLYPHSEKVYFLLNGDHRRHMLRISGSGKGDAKIKLGDQVFYEKLSRLRRQQAATESWKELSGLYLYPHFGKAEVIYRETGLYLSYGVVYETLLQPVGGMCFKQKSGPCRHETIEFRRDANTGEIASFVLNGMVFLRQFQPPMADK